VSEVVLQRPRVVPVVRELEPAGVAEHVWVGGERQPGRQAGPGHELADVARGHRPTALGGEQVRPLGVLPPELAEQS